MQTYGVVLHEQAWAALAATQGKERRWLLQALEELKADPFRRGDYHEADNDGRANEVFLSGEWLITYWSDHAVREIRVIRLETAVDN